MQIIATRHGRDVPIVVEPTDDAGAVRIVFEAQAGETIDDRDFWRELDPDEALELAAALRHHASEQRRRWKA